jgi:DNA invertase Pin-like site-specific DNA recombinase
MTGIGYVRVSSEAQAASGLGIEAQKEQISACAALQGVEEITFYVDAGVSGTTPLDSRPALLDALVAAKDKEVNTLYVAKLCRLSRDPLVAMTVERILEREKCRVVSAAGQGTEDDSPHHILMRRILQAVAENEAKMISLRTKEALAQKKKQGYWLGRVPFGYRVLDGKLYQCPKTFGRLQNIFIRRRRDKWTLQQIADHFNSNPHNSTKMSPSKLHYILKRGYIEGVDEMGWAPGEKEKHQLEYYKRIQEDYISKGIGIRASRRK